MSEYRWVNRRDAVERVYALMQPAVRFSRDECYDLPPCQVVNREVALTDHQRRLFLAMQAEAAIPELDIAAVNAADLGNKLLQIALGVVYDRNHRPIPLDVSPRLKELDAIIEESASKVIVFTPYKSTLSMLVDHLKKRWTVDFVSGDVHTTQREKIFTAFMHTPDPHVLVAHPECMSHGLTLTEASTIVWWGPPSSLETYEQANGRITRAGQRHSQLIVNMMGT
ncbi:SWF/SNF helicase family protein, partial [Klebsiella pneumoniae]|nr:SWF/SNF helicase family protein [Klebsiella pneumoniae]